MDSNPLASAWEMTTVNKSTFAAHVVGFKPHRFSNFPQFTFKPALKAVKEPVKLEYNTYRLFRTAASNSSERYERRVSGYRKRRCCPWQLIRPSCFKGFSINTKNLVSSESIVLRFQCLVLRSQNCLEIDFGDTEPNII